MKFSVCVMSHPKRKKTLNNLLNRLNSLVKPESFCGLYTVIDKDNNIWANTINSLLLRNNNSTHHITFQDDIYPCDDFFNIVDKALKLKPNNPISFFSMNPIMKDAIKYSWIKEKCISSMACVSLPVCLINNFIEFGSNKFKKKYNSSDRRLTAFCIENNIDCFDVVPSVVEHLDNKSLLRNVAKKRKATIYRNVKANQILKDESFIEREVDTSDFIKYFI